MTLFRKLLGAFTATFALSLLAAGAAQAEHFRFVIQFTSGTLAGSSYNGYIFTDSPTGTFTPDLYYGQQMISLWTTIGSSTFKMQDDVGFPEFPHLRYLSGGAYRFDFDASSGGPMSAGKWMWLYYFPPGGSNVVKLGGWRRTIKVTEAEGIVSQLTPIDSRKVPPEPSCNTCHAKNPK